MGTHRTALLARLVTAAVVAAAGYGVPARADDPPGAVGSRVAVLSVDPQAGRPIGEVRLPFPATHVGVRWQGGEEDPVEIRWRGTGGWGDWRRVSVWEDTSDHDAGVVAAGLVRPEVGATRLGVRWPAGVSQVHVVVIDAAASPRAAVPGVVRPVRVADRGPQPPVISRAGWGADERMRKGTPEFAPISKLIVHHTVTPNDDPDPAQTVRAIYAYHTRTNGWNDIGYNFLVDQQGRIYEGRFARRYRSGEAPTGEDGTGRGVVGAHASGVNPGTVGVAVLGDYSRGVAPPGSALDGVVRMLAWKAGRHHIDPHGAAPYTAKDGSRRGFPNIAGHRDVGRTGCPGSRLYERLPEIRRRVAEALGAAPAAPAPPPSPLPPPAPPVPEFPGFWAAGADGRIEAFGDVRSAGDLAGRKLGGPIVSLAAAPEGRGYWMAGADGGVFAFGDAAYRGAAGGQLRSPAVHLEPTPTGQGYWVLSAAGEVVPFGDAAFRGQLYPLPAEAIGLATTPTGQGYWIATADARVFAFGDAVLQAATGGSLPAGGARSPARPGSPTVAIAASPDGRGYWLLGRDGGVFSFGVPFHGSVVDRQPYAKAADLRTTDSGEGYYVAGADGAVFAFGDADRRRERPAGGPDTIAGVAFRPTAPRPGPPAFGPPAAPAPPGPPDGPPPAPPDAPEPAPPAAPGANRVLARLTIS